MNSYLHARNHKAMCLAYVFVSLHVGMQEENQASSVRGPQRMCGKDIQIYRGRHWTCSINNYVFIS